MANSDPDPVLRQHIDRLLTNTDFRVVMEWYIQDLKNAVFQVPEEDLTAARKEFEYMENLIMALNTLRSEN